MCHKVESLRKQLADTQAQLEKEKKEYMFLMADFDNFRTDAIGFTPFCSRYLVNLLYINSTPSLMAIASDDSLIAWRERSKSSIIGNRPRMAFSPPFFMSSLFSLSVRLRKLSKSAMRNIYSFFSFSSSLTRRYMKRWLCSRLTIPTKKARW